jgi:hypothetical protein
MMIDFGKILKRAWHILWNYRVLWIFGVLLALFAGSNGAYGSGSGYRFNSNNNGFRGVTPSNPDTQALNQWFQVHVFPLFNQPLQHIGTFVLIGVAIFLFILVISLIVAVIRYPAEAAAIRMVDGYEQSGEKVGFRRGWKLGWNRRAFRMWWVDFLTQGLPGMVLVAFFLALGIGTFITVFRAGGAAGAASIIVSALVVVAVSLIIGLGLVFLRLLRQFFWRKIALEDAGTRRAFREGWSMFKRNWKSALVMWLIMVGIKIGVGIAMAILFFLFIPLYVIMAIPAVVIAAVPGLLAFGISSLFTGSPWTWIIGLLFALPFFFLVITLPLTFVQGWYRIYDSSAWTLAYREMLALETVAPADLPITAP